MHETLLITYGGVNKCWINSRFHQMAKNSCLFHQMGNFSDWTYIYIYILKFT